MFDRPRPSPRTSLSTPQVIGLMKPAGGGGAYADLILRILRHENRIIGDACDARHDPAVRFARAPRRRV